ncbi:tail fiber protein [Croceivirga radicis]|uniref:tail fiber protein n=1 Tax=Croceivirga radicis TaxID=1929488 RepID=UPI000255B311|nr:tail fiber protein [Croceivirga radicis]
MNNLFRTLLYLCVFSNVLCVQAQTTYTYTLINADTDQPVISSFNSDITWDISNGSGLNLVTDVTSGFYRVKFSMSNGDSRTEGTSPYAAYGDMNGDYGNVAGTSDYFGWQAILGDLSFVVEYYLTATDYSNNQPSAVDNFTISIIEGASNPSNENSSVWLQTGDNATYLGNVGIGTNTPTAKLEINKAGTIGGDWNPTNSFLTLSDTNGASMIMDTNEIYGSTTLHIGTNSGDIIKFRSLEGNGVQERMIIKGNGNVGIGTTSPDSKLAVNGNIHAKEVKIDLVGWPDYVFKDDHNLPTLEEVEKHIKEKGHLPNIPSAKEVEENGVELGEMNRLLLEKIEEQMLYILQMERRIKELERRIK